jgi:outer membrane receptor for ferrienterochelin and colicin
MKKLLLKFKLILLLIPLHLSMNSQTLVSGKVLNEESSPLSFANIIVLDQEDSTLVKGDISNIDGVFAMNLNEGNYILEVSMLGYTSVYQSLVIADRKTTSLVPIQMSGNATLLEGVTVTAKKALFEKKVDRIIVNVQANAINKGNTVLNVLRSSPGLMVSNDAITMAGKQGVRIMLNGKIIRMPLDGVMQMLEGMSAANVESIELITNPGAQYEAEGNAGFINIVLTESPNRGWIANVGATIGMNQNINTGTNASLQYRGRKLSANVNYSFNYNKNEQIWNVLQSNEIDNFRTFTDSKTNRLSQVQTQNLNLGLTYLLSPKTELSFSLTGLQSLNRQNDTNRADQVFSVDSTLAMKSGIVEPNQWLNGSSSIGINHKLSTTSNLKVFYDHLRYQNRQVADYDLEFTSNNTSELLRSKLNTTKTTPILFHVFSADYDVILNPNLSISAGGRIALSTFENAVDVDLTGFPIYDLGAIEPKTFLDENIAAGYSQFTYVANANLTIEGGLRYERTTTDIRNAQLESVVERDYGNWFPTANITYKFNEKTSFQLVYNRRITRPTFNDLAPFVFFQNPSTLIQGNSELLPAIIDAVDVTLNKGKYWFTFQYARTNNFISFFTPGLDESNNVTYSTQNLDFMQMLGLNFNNNMQFTTWWSSNNSLSYQNFRIEDERSNQKVKRTINNFLINSNHAFQIQKTISANIGLNYNHSGFIGLLDYEPQWMLNAGISKRMKNGSQLSLRLTDIFSSYIWKGDFELGNATQYFLYDMNMRAIDLSWSMPFGNNKLKSVDVENGSANERARVN